MIAEVKISFVRLSRIESIFACVSELVAPSTPANLAFRLVAHNQNPSLNSNKRRKRNANIWDLFKTNQRSLGLTVGLNELENMLGRARSLFGGRQSRAFNYPDDLDTIYCKPLLDQNLVTYCKIQDATETEELDGSVFVNFVKVVRTTEEQRTNLINNIKNIHMSAKFENQNFQHLPLHGEYHFSALPYIDLCMISVTFQSFSRDSLILSNSSDFALLGHFGSKIRIEESQKKKIMGSQNFKYVAPYLKNKAKKILKMLGTKI